MEANTADGGGAQRRLALPESVLAELSHRLDEGEVVEAACECDMLLDGRFGKGWFLVTSKRLASYNPGANGLEWVSVPLNDVHGLQKREMIHGISVLEAKLADRAVPLARFTRARNEDVREVLQRAEGLLPQAEEARGHPHGEHYSPDGRRQREQCPKCGRPIPHWIGVCPDCLEKRKLIFRLLGRVGPHWPIAAGSLALMFLITAIDMVQPYLQKVLVDEVISKHRVDLLVWILVGLLSANASSAVFSGLRGYLMAWFGEKLIYDLRVELYNHLQRLSIGFYDSKQTGWIMDRVSSDTGNLQDFLAEGLQDFLRDVLSMIVIGAIMFSMSAKLALLTLLPVPLLGYLTANFMRRSRRLFHGMWRRRARIFALLSDVIPGVRVVKAFAQEEREQERFRSRAADYMEASVNASRVFATFWPTTGFVMSLGGLAIWGYGGWMVATNQPGVTLGVLVAFTSYLWRFYGPVQNISRMSQRLQRAATAAQRVFEVLDTRPDVRDPEHPVPVDGIEGAIEFDNVTFGYDPDIPVLHNISFSVKPGEMIGLVGASGAGKSTTINLICRFYDVQQGAVKIDGVDVRDMSLSALRDQIGVVLQEPFLFHGSVAENIAYGRPDATLDDIIEAARAANAHDFIMRLPEGYDTMVGERGARLSGGERQRISIARAILKNPRILILDEATSSVDTETEALIREAIDRLVKNRTTIAIAHRLSTLRNADRLIVLDKGRLVEMGTHEELMAKPDGVFRRLVDMQAELSKAVAVGG
ncbi:MAG: ABC transporter ATP-binding protein [Armatimonadota bacterium]